MNDAEKKTTAMTAMEPAAETELNTEAAVSQADQETQPVSEKKTAVGGKGSKRSKKAQKEQDPKKPIQRPPLKELESELQRERYKIRYRRVLRSTVFTLVTVAAIAILVATLWMPVLQIYGASMTPTLTDGDIVISRKVRNLKQGDIVAFYYNNRILVKRYIANAGDWVDIDEDGNVYVNGELLNEPYVYEKALGECNIELPYQVPENRIFVLGDHRSVSIDSRSSSVGCVAEDQIVGELVFCVWPFSNLGVIR